MGCTSTAASEEEKIIDFRKENIKRSNAFGSCKGNKNACPSES
jgi:hypothetical protein